MEDAEFDVIVLGTGLTESIVAAALSKWGLKVAHVDRNPYYGGEEASLTLDEFAKWIDNLPPTSKRYSRATRSGTVPPFARQYSICLCPTINPSLGAFVDALIQSGVSKHSGFRLLERVAVYDANSGFKYVPGSKEDVFTSSDISLLQKRRLMRFLTFAVGDFERSDELQGRHNLPFTDFLPSVFSLSKEHITVITYALAYACSPKGMYGVTASYTCNKPYLDSTISVLSRIQRYLRSVGRYGSSPFLVGHYGGVGELIQGFCRAAAVNGAVYILGRSITSISLEPTLLEHTDAQNRSTNSRPAVQPYSLVLEDIPKPLHAKVILGPTSYVPDLLQNTIQPLRISPSPSFEAAYSTSSVVRGVAILEHPVVLPIARPQQYSDDDSDQDDSDVEKEADNQTKDSNPPEKALDTSVLVFPPRSLDGGSLDHSAVVLITGEGSLSTPKGKYILYICLPVSNTDQITPSEILRPYLNIMLELGRTEAQEPLFTAFYAENLDETAPQGADTLCDAQATWVTPPPVPLCPLGDVADASASNAEITFFEVLRALGDSGERYRKDDSQNGGIWPRVDPTDGEDET